ncbi:MAG: molybdate ABC transporter permease subunit [Candidatus Sericytochromatia bacterium]|nr:molybdate ABC transporter permease subunit [Candidatus Tanganyikabacteria bacterium]
MTFGPLALSFQVALAAIAVAGVLGITLAGLLARARFPGRDLVEALILAPMVLPPTVLGYYLLVVLGRNSPLGQAYEALTGSPIVFTRTGAIVAATVAALPFVIKSARAAMEEVDPRLVGAARTLGAGALRAFLTVVLPLSSGGIVAGLALGFARALGEFGITLMIAGNIPGLTQTGALAIYDAVQADREAEATGMVLILTALAVAALYAVSKLTGRPRHGW